MNDHDGEQKAPLRTIQRRTGPPPLNLLAGISEFSNPFSPIALEASYASSSPSQAQIVRQNIAVSGKKHADNVGFKHVRAEHPRKIETPPKRSRLGPFHPPSANPGSSSDSNPRSEIASSLSPYANFLNGFESTSGPALLAPMPVQGIRAAQSSTAPKQKSPSPRQERGGGFRDGNEPDVASSGSGYAMGAASAIASSDDIVLDRIEDVYTSLDEKTKENRTMLYELVTLRNAHKKVTQEHQITREELDQTKLKLQEASLRIRNLNTLIEKNEAVFTEKIQDAARLEAAEKEKLLEELDRSRRESEEVKALLRLEVGKGDTMRVTADEMKKKVSDLVAKFDGLEKGRQKLGDSQLIYHKLVDRTAQELTELRKVSAEIAGRVSEHGENRQYLGQVRVTLAELKEELTDSQRVNDLLRDKLHSTSSQLAEVTSRLRELEDEKRGVWGDTLQRVARHAELQESAAASEKELVGEFRELRARFDELGTQTTQMTKRNQEMEEELVALRPLQQEKLLLQAEALDLSHRLAEETSYRKKTQSRLEEAKDALVSAEKESLVVKTQIQDVLESRRELAAELSNLRITLKELESDFASFREKSLAGEKEAQVRYEAKLSAVQEAVNKRDQEISAFQTKITLDEDMRDQLRTTLLREQATTSRLQQELKETTIREAMAMAKVDLFEGRIVNLNRGLENKEEIIRQLNSKVTSAQDRLEAQASTLRLTKEELGDMQEKMTNMIVSHEATLGKLRLENAVMEEQKSSISLAHAKLSAEMKAQEDAFKKKIKELQVKVDELDSVVKEREARIAAAHRESVNMETNAERLKAKVLQLETTLEQTIKEKEEQLGKLRSHETARVVALEGQIVMANEKIEDLEKQKEELVMKMNTLLERYKTGDLSDVEKDFTSVLFANARDLHEQASIAKDNEIKRRDKTIIGLQKRNSELEVMVAQMLQPADMDPSLLLNWKTPPPPQNVQDAAHGLPQPQPERLPSVAVAPAMPGGDYEIDIVPPIPSQIASELSTPPQSPRSASRVRGTTISFVQLSNEDSEKDEHQPEKAASLKRFGEDEPEIDVGTTKKRVRVGVSKKVANREGAKGSDARGRGRPKKKRDRDFV